ncbi:pentapeptide repeat-containing protein [Amycolatopsis sp. cg9]|uniref:pentapeptide repeat-containing protein n=1 Tax=Amycolatopsis sp. cg9 TaxID=3238801 RepID=UPI003526B921
MAHLDPAELGEYFSRLTPGADIDLRGTTIDSPLLNRVSEALTRPGDSASTVRYGRADFRGAIFVQNVEFGRVNFTGNTYFRGATFNKEADFRDAVFGDHSDFRGARFTEHADFRETTFTKRTDFGRAAFAQGADFDEASFTENADFGGAYFAQGASFQYSKFAEYADFGHATFKQNTSFNHATFTENANFRTSKFKDRARFDKVTFGDNVNFRAATFTNHASFDDAVFAKQAMFSGATSIDSVDFTGANFAEAVVFRGISFTGFADFSGATFAKHANFLETNFANDAGFRGTNFARGADFIGTRFGDRATFTRATFTRDANFRKTIFIRTADFCETSFSEDADFSEATFAQDAIFRGVHFGRVVNFHYTTCAGSIDFANTTLANNERLGPLIADRIDLRGAQFETATTIEAETSEITCQRARFTGGVELRIRHGLVDLAETFMGTASSLATSAGEFTIDGLDDLPPLRVPQEQIDRWRATGYSLDHRPVLKSLRGTDVSELALTDVDLRWCRFAGAHHLDKLRIEGDSPFSRPPRAWWRDARQVVFEEHPWRARLTPKSGWSKAAPFDKARDQGEQVGADRLAALYRSLRKALEDGKNEAGAGDFYYGEQEARRRADGSSLAERKILLAYWLISGYGQRAARAFVALLGVIAVTTVLLVTCGLPAPGPASQSTTITRGSQTTTIVEDPRPQLPASNARWTWSRLDASVRIALGAVVFRDASQKLTTAGVWAVMIARFTGPILLALTALAIRARVKR